MSKPRNMIMGGTSEKENETKSDKKKKNRNEWNHVMKRFDCFHFSSFLVFHSGISLWSFAIHHTCPCCSLEFEGFTFSLQRQRQRTHLPSLFISQMFINSLTIQVRKEKEKARESRYKLLIKQKASKQMRQVVLYDGKHACSEF